MWFLYEELFQEGNCIFLKRLHAVHTSILRSVGRGIAGGRGLNLVPEEVKLCKMTLGLGRERVHALRLCRGLRRGHSRPGIISCDQNTCQKSQ